MIDHRTGQASQAEWRRSGGALGIVIASLLILSEPAVAQFWGHGDAEQPADSVEVKRNPDPWEKFNRGIFVFNEAIDIYGIAPVASGWHFIVPDPVETGIRNFFDNIDTPMIFANHILQAKPARAAEDLARIIYNTSLGLAGFIDVATMLEIPDNETDFGLTFARWGAPAGPYFMLPLWGASTVRDALGVGALFGANPYGYFVPFWASVVTRGVQVINTRAYYLEEIAEERKAALDFYVFMRDAYIQNRSYKVRAVRGEKPFETRDDLYYEEEDLYFFDDEEEEEEEGTVTEGADGG